MMEPWLRAVAPRMNWRPTVEDAMEKFRAVRPPRHLATAVAPYSHPSDGSTLVLLDEPSAMTRAQVASWAKFNQV